MADYRAMYHKMMRATEQALHIIITAQRECEELYLQSDETAVNIVTTEKVMQNTEIKSNDNNKKKHSGLQ